MYLLATHIPIYVDGRRTYVDDSWYADIELARRFFVPHFGKLQVLGPSLPTSEAPPNLLLREVPPEEKDLSLHPSIDERTRIRDYWPEGMRAWNRDVARLIQDATVVHASVDDPFLPMQLATMRAGLRANKVTVLIGFDMDVWEVLPTQLRNMSPANGALHVMRTAGADAWMRYCVRHASVAMLKEGKVYDRYAGLARNPKSFCHSMHGASQVIAADALERRLASMQAGRPLRLGYFGRFIERKGLADSIRIVAAARQRDVDATLSLIGDGPQLGELRDLAGALGIAEHVDFAGFVPYGDELHARVRALDAVLFTPAEEDTPRMVYDAYAAGLPLLTTDIFFLRRRAEVDGVSKLFGVGAIEDGAAALAELDGNRAKLAQLSRLARQRGEYHTVENWYGQRLDWTLEAAHLSGVSTTRSTTGTASACSAPWKPPTYATPRPASMVLAKPLVGPS